MRPELNFRKKVKALERRKAHLDALIDFIKTHPLTAAESRLFAFAHKTGLIFEDYAVIRPIWKSDKPALRLERHSEDSFKLYPEDDNPQEPGARSVCDDVTGLSDTELMALLEKLHRELVPEDFEDADNG
jgi:hypothetical protein